MHMSKEPLLKFPCLFPIKIMGLNDANLVPQVINIITNYCKDSEFNPNKDIHIKTSKKGNYLSVTATIMAQSQEQLDNIYINLNNNELVKVTL